jgi:hypothetical protein
MQSSFISRNFSYPNSTKPQSFSQVREGWKRHPFLFSLKRKDTAYSPTPDGVYGGWGTPKNKTKTKLKRIAIL